MDLYRDGICTFFAVAAFVSLMIALFTYGWMLRWGYRMVDEERKKCAGLLEETCARCAARPTRKHHDGY